MTESNVAPAGNTPISSAIEEDAEPKNKVDVVEKALKEKNNWKKRAEDAEVKYKLLEDERLKEKEDFKKLYENKLAELQVIKKDKEESDKKIQEGLKIGALKNELSKLGMDMKYMDIAMKAVDLNTLKVEDDVVLGVESAAKSLKEKAAPLFVSAGPNVSHAAPASPLQPLTLEEWEKLPIDQQVKREPELLATLGFKFKP